MIRFLYLPAIDDGGSGGKFFLFSDSKSKANCKLIHSNGAGENDG
jgi:hypothetical protein